MTLYACVSNGLRGCYMPDSACVLRFSSRRELKAFLESESRAMREAYGHGGTKRQIQWAAAEAWRRRKAGWSYDLVIPFGNSRAASDRPFGLFIGHATRAEYMRFQRDNCA